MANWRYHIELAAIIDRANGLSDDDVVPDDIKRAMASEVKKAPPIAHFARSIMQATTIRSMNRVVERLYNTADATMVWCGL